MLGVKKRKRSQWHPAVNVSLHIQVLKEQSVWLGQPWRQGRPPWGAWSHVPPSWCPLIHSGNSGQWLCSHVGEIGLSAFLPMGSSVITLSFSLCQISDEGGCYYSLKDVGFFLNFGSIFQTEKQRPPQMTWDTPVSSASILSLQVVSWK